MRNSWRGLSTAGEELEDAKAGLAGGPGGGTRAGG